MDGDIVYPGVRMGGVAHSQRDVGPGVIRCIGGGRDQGSEVKIRVICPVDYLLAGGCLRANHGRDGAADTIAQGMTQLLRPPPQQGGHPAPAGQDADGDPSAGMALDLMKEHGRPFPGGPLDRPSSSYVTVDSRQLSTGVYRNICLHQLSRL